MDMSKRIGSLLALCCSLPLAACDDAAVVDAGGAQNALPCDVAQVLADNCWNCHGSLPRFTAPMSLVTTDDFVAVSPLSGQPYSAAVQARIHHPSAPMPPAPAAPLDAATAAVLDNWVAAGMPAGTCTEGGGQVLGGSGGQFGGQAALPGNAGTGALAGGGGLQTGTGAVSGGGGGQADGSGGNLGTGGSGGNLGTGGVMPPAPAQECYRFTAHNGDKTTPYAVPTTPDYYSEFYFTRPWSAAQVHGLSAKSIIDNDRAIHHWILYSTNGTVVDGSQGEGLGAHPDGQFIAGWAPGAQDTIMPAGVGLQVPGQGLVLEVHYNAPGPGQTDASGVELCVTPELLPNTAATHPLGAELFNTQGAGDVTGACRPKGPYPITIISSSPHMHKQGVHMKTIVTRANGSVETLIDKPFNFDGQLAYDTPMVINAGDTLTTTCSYASGVRFGTGTSAEMCYNFVLAYPAGALSNGSFLSTNGNSCIQ